jgi:hypothetical protein
MNVIHNQTGDDGTILSTVERQPGEDLHGTFADGFYLIGTSIFSGHDINNMQRAYWNSAAQEWKEAP